VLWTVDGFVGNIGICLMWSTYVASMFILAVWESAGSFIPSETKLVGCLAVVLGLVQGKLAFCRVVKQYVATSGNSCLASKS